MADPVPGKGQAEQLEAIDWGKLSRKAKRKILKKLKRKQVRIEAAIREREENASLNALEEQLPLSLWEKEEEAEQAERAKREFEERERIWLEQAAARKAREEEDEQRKKLLEDEEKKAIHETDDDYEYVEEGPSEIIWQGNEIIIKKGKKKIAKRIAEQFTDKEDDKGPTSNPLPPQCAAFASCAQAEPVTMQEVLDSVAQQVPNFGTEQDKAHCPFHLKTGACRFGSRCSRVHFYPEKSCTLLIKNMYNGPGLICEQDEGLEHTDEEIERCYEEFYEDVHTEFLKFGEIVNFKVCKNTSYHLRGNLYVHYKSLESAITAYNTVNARYYAGKQIVCEFTGVTKWKVAICGEFMKSRLKTCSHGSACNFIHCFRNPGGDYEWADWDNPPPRYWIKKMIVLFGTSPESTFGNELESDDYNRHRDPKKMRKLKSYRHQSERSHYSEMDWNYSSSDGDELNTGKHQHNRHSGSREHSSKRRGHRIPADEDEAEEGTSSRHQRADVNVRQNHSRHERRRKTEGRSSGRRKREVYSEELENSKSEDRSSGHRKTESEDRWSSRRKMKVYSEEAEDSEGEDRWSSHKKRKVYSDIKKHESSDRQLESTDRWGSISESEERSSRRKRKVHSEEQEYSEHEDRLSGRRKRKVCSEDQEKSESKSTSKSYKKRERKHESIDDRHFDHLDHWDSTNGHSFGSLNQFEYRDIHSEKDSGKGRK